MAISNDDGVLIASLCLMFADGPTCANLTSVCKDALQYRYGRAKKDTSMCVACGKIINLTDINSTCSYHPDLIKTWINIWEDQYDGTLFSGYDAYTCCGKYSDGCKKAPHHNVTGKRCQNCGLIAEGKTTKKGLCQFHPDKGATGMTDKWTCCGARTFGAPGCKIEAEHNFPKYHEEIHGFVWSRLGTKALVRTESRLFALQFHEKSRVWSQHYILKEYPVTGGSGLFVELASGLDCGFSYDAMKILVRDSKYKIFDIKSETYKDIADRPHTDYFTHSWGPDTKFLYYISAAPNSDYGIFVLNAMELGTGKVIKFVNFTTSIPFDYNTCPNLDKAFLVPAGFGVTRSFKHPQLASFIDEWVNSDSQRLMDPYGNRMLFVSRHKKASHFSYEVKNGSLEVDVLGHSSSIWGGIGNPLCAIHWTKTGFLALVQQNFKGFAFYKRHKYEVWWFTNKLEKTKTCRLPKECRVKGKELHREDGVTMFKYDEASNQFFFALNTKFFVLNDKLEVIFSMPWASSEFKSSTFFHPRSRVAVYSQDGLTAHIPLNPVGEVTKGYLFDEQFFSQRVKAL